jgi:hypothetical protein
LRPTTLSSPSSSPIARRTSSSPQR